MMFCVRALASGHFPLVRVAKKVYDSKVTFDVNWIIHVHIGKNIIHLL